MHKLAIDMTNGVLKKSILLFWILCIGLSVPAVLVAADNEESRGLIKRKVLVAETVEGDSIELYRGSYALLIGASKYSEWSHLPSIQGELDAVERALASTGFEVQRLVDPDADRLKRGVQDFINAFGYEPENRLLIYFSGHGYTVGEKGFLLPVDIPLPEELQEFRRRALPMTQVLAWAKDIEAKHALFVFDSCFSGSVFKSKNMPSAAERYVRKATSMPVRQFITAGSANEEVPAKSTFTPAFVAAIMGEGDLNEDGYITGSELGVHLAQTVPRFVDQTPQYGKIREYGLSRGDFVFFNPSAAGSSDENGSELVDSSNSGQVIKPLPDSTLDAMMWQSAERGNSLSDYLAYLDKYPGGLFKGLADARVAGLQKSIPLETPGRRVELPFEPEMVAIRAGSFAMGSSVGRDAEKPVHIVNIEAFEIGRFEVTFAQFDAYTDAIASEQIEDNGWGRGEKPVVNVSWKTIQDYIVWLNTKSNKAYRLPTEAEWEYVSRAGNHTVYSFGDDESQLCKYANIADDNKVCSDGQKFTANVGKFEPNEWGVFDMHGNVREWVNDCWHPDYIGAPVNGRAWTRAGNCDKRVVRGGSWYSLPNMQRSSVRNKLSISSKGNGTGFRLARSL